MKFPNKCPGCQSQFVAVTGQEQTALRGTVRYACGTVFSLYDAMVQVSNPCYPSAQWHSLEGFKEVLHLRAQIYDLEVVAEDLNEQLLDLG